MFNITDQKGFHITFANGFTVSVQFGNGNYCDNYSYGCYGEPVEPSRTVEVAAWDSNKDWIKLGVNDDAIGYQTAEQVLAIMNRVAAMQAKD